MFSPHWRKLMRAASPHSLPHLPSPSLPAASQRTHLQSHRTFVGITSFHPQLTTPRRIVTLPSDLSHLRPKSTISAPHSAHTKLATMAPIPKTMSGILIEQVGGVDVLKWKTDLPVPELKEGEVLVKNEFIGVNYIDTYFRTGLYKAPLPLITGKEASGKVIALHPSVSTVKEGTPVVYLGDHAYAEFTAVPAATLIPIPDGISPEIAAASLLQGLTALTLVKEAGGIKQELGVSLGPWVLVHAAAGGTGSNMVQVLKVLGAKVIGTAGGKEKCELVKSLGAGWVIDSKTEDLVARVKEITGGNGVDVIFDGVGKATFDADFEMVARKGTIVSFGNASGPVEPVNLLRLGAKNVKLLRPVLFGYIHTKEERDQYTAELFDLLRTGKLIIKIHDVYPLKEVARAHSDLEGRRTTGKLLLKL